jgi:tetratricopeptide (TPR) repeat protein
MDLVWAQREADLLQWLKAFPEEMVLESPWLLLYLSRTRQFISPVENQISLQKSLTLFEKAGDTRGCPLALAYLIGATLIRGHDLVPISVLLAKGEDLLNTLGQDLYPRERANLWNQIGIGFIVRAGNLRKGYWACQNAFLLAKETKDVVQQIEAVIHGSEALIFLWEFSLADEKLIEIEKLIRKHPFPASVMYYHILRFRLLLHKGTFEEADELIQFVKREYEGLGIVFLYQVALIDEFNLKPHLGQYRETEEAGQRFLQLFASVGASFMTGCTLMNLGRSAYFEGNYKKARDYLQKAREILSKEEVLSPLLLNLSAVMNGFLWRPVSQMHRY